MKRKNKDEAALVELMRTDRLVQNQREVAQNAEAHDQHRAGKQRGERERRKERECQQPT
jgi:hypothetical protein